MKIKPKYAENIIVFVYYNKKGYWYVSDKGFWYLDLRVLAKIYEDLGFNRPESYYYSQRLNIDVLNEKTAGRFIKEFSEYEVSKYELTNLLASDDDFEICELSPSLYVNFDTKTFYSYFPELIAFENYAPVGWTSEYRRFESNIPDKYKYWIKENVNLLEKEKIK